MALSDVQNLRVIPRWLKPWLEEKDLSTIRDAVTRAEEKTSAEIVPMIVRRSIAVGHVPLILFLFFSAIGLMMAPSLKLFFQLRLPHVPLFAFDLIGVILGAGFALWLARYASVQRLTTSMADTFHQVHTRAHLEFETSNVRKTSLHTGILLFVSLTERKVVIMADEAISKRLPQEVWIETIEPLLKRIKAGELALGLSEAIVRCGELTQDSFPAREGHRNELSNDLMIKD